MSSELTMHKRVEQVLLRCKFDPADYERLAESIIVNYALHRASAGVWSRRKTKEGALKQLSELMKLLIRLQNHIGGLSRDTLVPFDSPVKLTIKPYVVGPGKSPRAWGSQIETWMLETERAYRLLKDQENWTIGEARQGAPPDSGALAVAKYFDQLHFRFLERKASAKQLKRLFQALGINRHAETYLRKARGQTRVKVPKKYAT